MWWSCALINYVYHAPLCASPAVRPINLSPPVFILTFQTSEQLQTAGTSPHPHPPTPIKDIFPSFPPTGDFFLPNYYWPKDKMQNGDILP